MCWHHIVNRTTKNDDKDRKEYESEEKCGDGHDTSELIWKKKTFVEENIWRKI